MRAWIFVLAVLATFQAAIVQVAGTEPAAAAMVEHTQSKSQHPRKQHRIATSPVLSFAAIVASAEKSESEFSLTSSNNIVLNSDNVKHPPHADYELLVPTNSPSSSLSAVASPSAKSVVHKINVNFSGNSNSIDSSKPVQRRRSRVNSNQGQGHRVRQRRREENRRRRRQRGHRRSKKSPALSQLEEVRINSNELNVHEEQQQPLEEKVKQQQQQQEVEVENEEDEEQQQQEAEQVERAKPDPETLVTIEKNLLSLFGFKKRPKIDRSKVVIPEAMRRMYAETTGMELDLPDLPKPAIHRSHYTANTVRSFTHEESKIDHRFHHHHRFRLHFNTTNIPADELVKAAELVLSRDAVPDADLIRHKVQVFDIVRPGVKGKREPSFLLIDTKIVKVNSTENLVLDVKPALERWQREPKHNHGLLVHVSTVGRRGPKRVQQQQPAEGEGITLDGPMHHHVRLRRSVRESEDSWAKKQPLLFAYTDDKRHRSSRAATKEGGHHHNGGGGRARNRSKKKPRGICQRHALWVDFEDVGWNDWIVAPRGYDAFYCKGECRIPMADHLNATNHAVVQTLVNSINGQLAPRACCVPTQLTTISLLYLDDQNKLVLKKYQDMAVVGCGCR